ncbi:hypothetical protein PQX77_010668 [Marasmius sp. AFHP31]|nr:hypothetical protein PQX77_010668 [Marasmius sp. AFHP31]
MLQQTRYFLRSLVKGVDPSADQPGLPQKTKPTKQASSKKRKPPVSLPCPRDGDPLPQARSSTPPPLPPEPLPDIDRSQPIAVFRLPETFDYDALVERAACEQEDSKESITEDLGTHVSAASTTNIVSNASPCATGSDSPTPMPPRIAYHRLKRSEARTAKRKAEKELRRNDYTPSPRAIDQAMKTAKAIRLDTDAENFDAAKGAHTGKRGTVETYGTKEEVEREWTLEELIDLGYTHIPWDGVHPLLIVDCKGRIVAFFAGRPNRVDFVEDMTKVFDAMMEASKSMGWLGGLEVAHKRGFFHAYNAGVTMGMGSATPVVLRNSKPVQGIIQRLLDLPGLQRLSGYQNSVVKLWQPDLHRVYRETVATMHKKLPHLPRNFSNNIFTAAAFNFGGHVRSIAHRDHMNWALGQCVITAMGRFDAARSAHLVLKEFKMVVNFPHASTAVIPSACATHFNTRIAPGDTRTSFTQYTAGAIFRWVENGCRTEAAVKDTNKAEWLEIQEKKKTAVAERLRLYSNINDLLTAVPDL